jgi:hypothetical protein
MSDNITPGEVAADSRTFWQRTKDYAKEVAKANARRFATWAACLLAASVYNCANGPGKDGDIPLPPEPDFVWPDNPFGRIVPTEADYARTLKTVPLFSETEAGRDTKWKDGDAVLLYRLHKAATGKDFGPYQQGELGCCVSFGSGGAVEMELAAQIALQRAGPQQWDVISREVIYGGGRINIRRQGLPSEGMMGSWAAEWLNKYGAVGTKQAPADGAPIGPYNVSRCAQWGSRGVPQEVVDLGKSNPAHVSLVQSAADVQNAIGNGYPVFICSQVGFGRLSGPPLQRDKDGFLRESGSWPHCMFVAGYRGGSRKGFLIINSWGAGWITGPKGFGDEPEGSFWCDYVTMDKITKGGPMDPPDSFAVSTVGGFKRRKLDLNDWIVAAPDSAFPPRQRLGTEGIAFGWIGGKR